jgi:hypothetical protein
MKMGDDRSMRDELRGERGFQYGLSRDAQDDDIRRVTLEDALINSQFGRDQRRVESMMPYAFGDNSQNLMNYAGNVSGQADDSFDDFGLMLMEYLRKQQGQGGNNGQVGVDHITGRPVA